MAAESGSRVVLVVLVQPDELLLDRFWLITSLDAETVPAAELLELYRQRGRAEAYMGELIDVLEPALSSAPRTKRHYRGRRLHRPRRWRWPRGPVKKRAVPKTDQARKLSEYPNNG